MTTRQLLNVFSRLGYNQHSSFSQERIYLEVNRIIKNENHPLFSSLDQYVAEQLWEQCRKNPQSEVYLQDYIEVVVAAKIEIEKRLQELEDSMNKLTVRRQSIENQIAQIRNSADESRLSSLNFQLDNINKQLASHLEDHTNFDTDYKNIMVMFGKNSVIRRSSFQPAMSVANVIPNALNRSSYQSKGLNNSQYNNLNNSKNLPPTKDLGRHSLMSNNPNVPVRNSVLNNSQKYEQANNELDNSRQHSQIFFKRSDKTLLALLVISLIVLFLQLFMLFHKNGFLTLLLCMGLIGIFALNYFDRFYIQLLMVITVLSWILDLVWMIVKANNYWNPAVSGSHAVGNVGFTRFIVVMVAIIMALKIAIFFILLSYSRKQERTSIVICGYDVTLTGEAGDNPISNTFPHLTNQPSNQEPI